MESNFTLHTPLENISDAMMIEDSKPVATLEFRGWKAELACKGQEEVMYKGKTYHAFSDFPDRLQDLVRHNSTWYTNPDVNVIESRYYDLTVYNPAEPNMPIMEDIPGDICNHATEAVIREVMERHLGNLKTTYDRYHKPAEPTVTENTANRSENMETQYMDEKDLLIESVEKFTKDNLLPSGSGFDFAWNMDIQEDKNTGRGVLHCSSFYEGMDEGMYLEPLPIEIQIPMDNPDEFNLDFHGDPSNFDEAVFVESRYGEAYGSFEELRDMLEEDVAFVMDSFDPDKKRYEFLTDAAKRLGYETPHANAKGLQFDFSKFSEQDYASFKHVLETVTDRESFQKAKAQMEPRPQVFVNGLGYEAKPVYNENLKAAGIRFNLMGKEKWLANKTLPATFPLALDRIGYDGYQKAVKVMLSKDIEEGIEMGNITKDILKSRTPKEAAKCIKDAKKRRAEEKASKSVGR